MRIKSQVVLGLVLAAASSEIASAQAPGCVATHQAFVQGGVAQGRMHVINDGMGCGLTFKFGGAFDPSDWKVEEAPKHGRLEVGGSNLKYFPSTGYAGPDSFTVAVFGYNPMLTHGRRARDGRFAFKVDVRSAP
jgi:hypothetical protein